MALTRQEMALIVADSIPWTDGLLARHQKTLATIAGEQVAVCTTCTRPAAEGNGPLRWPCAPGDLGQRAYRIQVQQRRRHLRGAVGREEVGELEQ